MDFAILNAFFLTFLSVAAFVAAFAKDMKDLTEDKALAQGLILYNHPDFRSKECRGIVIFSLEDLEAKKKYWTQNSTLVERIADRKVNLSNGKEKTMVNIPLTPPPHLTGEKVGPKLSREIASTNNKKVANKTEVKAVITKAPKNFQEDMEDKVSEKLGKNVAKAAQNEKVQQKVGTAVSEAAKKPEVQAKVGKAIAQNSNNKVVAAVASNSTAQKAVGTAAVKLATNKTVQKGVAKAVTKAATDKNVRKKAFSIAKSMI